MTPKVAASGAGSFQWNKGGWFGSQLGSTCWMLWGLAMAPTAPVITAIWLACFVIANAVGTSLWMRRDRIRPYPAIQWLLAVVGISGLAALFAFDRLAGPGDRALIGRAGFGIPGIRRQAHEVSSGRVICAS